MKKVKILLVIGFLFTLFVFFGASKDVGDNIFEGMIEVLSGGDLYLLICTFLYPLGVVYNWRNMFGFASTSQYHEPADRYYTRMERTIFHNGNLMSRILMIGLAVSLGWIPGVYYAFKTLRYLKKQENKE